MPVQSGCKKVRGQGSLEQPSYASDGAVEGEITCAVNVDVVVLPALDLGRDEIARDAKEHRNERHIVEQRLLCFAQYGRARDRIALLVGPIDQRLDPWTAVCAVVQVWRG